MSLEHALLAGGGSGGHVFPALAVADELARRNWRVSWLGRVEGMERRLVEQAGLRYFGLPARAVVGRSPWQRALALLEVGFSAVRARSLIRRWNVQVILGTGGYASAPGVLGAALAGRPSVLLEVNAVAGAANRWLSRWSTAAAVAQPAVGRELRCRVQPTGVPVRREFSGEFERPPAGPATLLVLGGSQGARQLNQLLPPALGQLEPTPVGLRVIHQVGAALVEETRLAYRAIGLEGIEVEIVPFLDEVAAALRSAHLVVSRAGAVTLAEICAVGRAALLLPLSMAEAHQLANARRLTAIGGAEMLTSEEVSPARLAAALGELLADPARLVRMGRSNRELFTPGAAAAIADLVEDVARAA